MPTGTLVLPPPDKVIAGFSYGAGGTEFTGTAASGSASPPAPPTATGGGTGPRLFGLPTTLPAILDAIETRAAVCLSLDRSYVFTTLDLGDMETTGAPADVFVALFPQRGRAEQPDVAGGGPDALIVEATVGLELWARVEADEAYRDTAALKDTAFGVLARWRLLLNRNSGLQLFAPVPPGGQVSILKEPMRLVDWDVRPRVPAAGWVKHVSRWEVKYREDTTT